MKALVLLPRMEPYAQHWLAALDALGVTVRVTTAGPVEAARAALPPSVGVSALAPRHRLDLRAVRALAEVAAAFAPDFVFACSSRLLATAVLAAARARGRWPILVRRGVPGSMSALNPMDWLTYFNPRVDRIVAISEAICAHYRRHWPYRWLIPPKRAVSWPLGADYLIDVPRAEQPALRRDGERPAVLFVANNRPFKGFAWLLAAWQKLPVEGRPRLVVIGSGYEREQRAAATASPSLAGIEFLGAVRPAVAHMHEADVLVQPSIRPGEGLGKTMLEAMSRALPVVTSDVTTGPEVVADGVSGIVVPENDAHALASAITRLCADADLRRRMGEAGRQRLRDRYSVEACARRLIKIAEEAIRERDSRT